MADDVQIRVEADAILRRFERMPAEQRQAVRRGLAIGMLAMESQVRIRTGVKSRRGGAGLMGRLTSHVLTLSPASVDGVIGFRKRRGFPYEYAQEEGAKAKPGKAMAVPVTPEARAVSERGAGPRAFPRRLFIPEGTHVLAETQNDRARTLIVHYVLMKSIPPRLRFRQTVQEETPAVLRQIVIQYRKSTGASEA